MAERSLTRPRERLVTALETDLVGPYADLEVLELPPSRWYLTGFLAPEEGREPQGEAEDPLDQDDPEQTAVEGEEDSSGPEPSPKQKNRLPASLGLTVFLPPAPDAGAVTALVRFAEYEPELEEPAENAEEGSEGGDSGSHGDSKGDRKRRRTLWRRLPRGPFRVDVPLEASKLRAGLPLPEMPGVRLQGLLEETRAPGLAPGTRALSLFLVNAREPAADRSLVDQRYLFQVSLELRCEEGFVPRPNRRDEGSADWDDRTADLQFREAWEWAVGHGVSVMVPETSRGSSEDGRVHRVRTTWVPQTEVPRVTTHREPGIVLAMEELGELEAEAVRSALGRLPEAYGEWIAEQREIELDSERRRETRDRLMEKAGEAKRRIEVGLELLESDATVLEAFRLANRAMAMAARQRNPERYEGGEGGRDEENVPEWRLFQLAFVLLGLPGMRDPEHPDREVVDLIFFPTGGGKTEAYLGLIAFTLLLRRLTGRERPDGGLGVAVLLRYTLRLLTLDQLARAATLICALEVLRWEAPERLGDVRFSVGLWVGRTATANRLGDVVREIRQYKTQPYRSSPFPLTHCPWCRRELDTSSLEVEPNMTHPQGVAVGCSDFRCAFSRGNREHPDGLPVLFVDEQIYRELPCFLVATVDKFALLPWKGETGKLFGQVAARRDRAFFGPMNSAPSAAEPLPAGLRPPELIVQDELHLISGPLGTMVGLYESAIDALCRRPGESEGRPPKVVASTATVRRAGRQIQSLFGREETALFPPPGVEANETWFATVDRDGPGRLYVGLGAPGRAMKALLWRTYVALLAAARRAFDEAEGEEERKAADALTTLVGYFNSLRELGGMRRLVEDEVRSRAEQVEAKRPLGGDNPWGRNRRVQVEPLELTSRVTRAQISEARARLEEELGEDGHADVLLASNMISVGVDIDRLGLMVVAGQPKSTSEYIQATSRVGRDAQRPGLVATCFNLHRPRDRSHYERFPAYHESFYRAVEAMSLTPFSGPALERGLAGTALAMVRLLDPEMTPPGASMLLPTHRSSAEEAVARLVERAAGQPGLRDEDREAVRDAVARRGRDFLDRWEELVKQAKEGAYERHYSPYDGGRPPKPLLRTRLEQDRMEQQPEKAEENEGFVAPTSMRDVEPSVHLWIRGRDRVDRSE